ncbi:hypothetical protein FSP39_023163 [Pinctada imbricata]|uniref:CCHC-type domain-containing protein n=1 Tax=Pinctada imbricata TaxID=66713 RepID=A0AA89BZT3_PINIB|nr:hypothetical protein FSP39_023163 [Pinctada imbricata]
MTSITEDELKNMSDAFKEMGVTPSASTKEEFQKWLLDFGKGTSAKGATSIGSASLGTKVQHTFKEHPRLPNFSGDKKSDVNFDLWKYEVECLVREKYTEEIIAHSIRRSLRGEAGRIAMRLGSHASVTEILEKFESIYGIVDKKQMLLSKFYSAKQDVNEDVTAWSCRLEDLLQKINLSTRIPQYESEQMLRDIFWEGLKPSLKDTSGHIYDKNLPFEELLREMRIKEDEIRKRSDKSENSNSVSASKSEISELKDMIQTLNNEISTIKEGMSTQNDAINDQFVNYQQPFDRSFHGHAYSRPLYQRVHSRRGSRYTSYRGNARGYHSSENYVQPQYTDDGQPICLRCGQSGHLRIGCRVILDHVRRPSNFNRPVSRRGR